MHFPSIPALLLLALALPEQALACYRLDPVCAGGVKTNPPGTNPTCGCPGMYPPCDEYFCAETGWRQICGQKDTGCYWI